jgi:hypothetical protein
MPQLSKLGKKFRKQSLLLALILPAIAFAEVPFKSKEEINFVDKKTDQRLAFAEVDSFQGILKRLSQTDRDLKTANVYAFAGISEIKMTKPVCEKLLAKIFGPLDKITLKVKNVEIFKTDIGDSCQAQVVDDYDSKALIPEQLAVLGFIHGKPMGLVFSFHKKSDAAAQDNIRAFWQGLR